MVNSLLAVGLISCVQGHGNELQRTRRSVSLTKARSRENQAVGLIVIGPEPLITNH